MNPPSPEDNQPTGTMGQRSLMDRTLWPSIVLLVLLFVLLETTNIDLWVQDHFYDFNNHSWLVDIRNPWSRKVFHTGLKSLVWLIGLCAAMLALLPESRVPRNLLSIAKRRPDLWILVFTLAAAPLLVATSKATTNVFTPAQVRRYDGFAPYVRHCQSYPANDRPKKRGRAFPAGHASGGFALMALAGIAVTRRQRLAGFAVGATMGATMGIYQMLNGSHYLSHTVYTAFICWIVFLGARRVWYRGQRAHGSRAG